MEESGAPALTHHLPVQGLTGGQRHDLGAGKGQALGNGPVLALQGNGAGIGRPSVEAGAVQACKGIQLVQCAGSLEGPGIELQGMGAGIAAGTAIANFLQRTGMGCAVGPQEEARIARLSTGRQYQCGRSPPVKMALRL